jgi:hypothetical protein
MKRRAVVVLVTKDGTSNISKIKKIEAEKKP